MLIAVGKWSRFARCLLAYCDDGGQLAVIRVVVEPPNFADWSVLLGLLQESFAFMSARIDPPSSLNRLDAKGLASKAASETLIVAFDLDALVGCTFAKPIEDALYVGKVAVRGQYRGQGIARQMIAAAEALARHDGLEYLQLQSRIELTEVHEAFAALGFTKTGESRHAGFRRPTSITMRKPISTR